jgi:uncharacterized protein YhaN
LKFKSISIDGYGRFTQQDLEFHEGLQVVGGPNEQGKSTLRNYIGDMLYGQKRNTSKRMYDAANEFRKPWNGDHGYGGRLIYTMDNGDEIEVHRVFDRKDESVKVFDRTHGEEITHTFPILKNRESTFAENHLGMTKSVYLGMATISHLSLSGLGDKEALASIREKLLSLADSGGDKSSAENAIKWLEEWQAAIGSKNARTKPLAKTRVRLDELEKEYREVVDIRQEVSVIERQRNQIREEIGSLLNQRNGLERELENIELAALQNRLDKAEELNKRFEELTQHCTELGSAREFGLDNHSEMVHVQTLVEHARGQVNESRDRYTHVQKELDQEKDRLEKEGIPVMVDPDPKDMTELIELEGVIKHGTERLEQVTEWRAQSEVRYMDAQKELVVLPDFTRITGDPIDWISQQIEVFNQSRAERDTARNEQGILEERIESLEEDVKPLKEWFEPFKDFIDVLREFETMLLHQDEENKMKQQHEMDLRHSVEDRKSRLPIIAFASFGALIAAVVCVVVATTTLNTGFYLPASLLTLFAFLSGSYWLLTRRGYKKANKTLDYMDENELTEQNELGETDDSIAHLMKITGCSTSRELEGYYEQFLQKSERIKHLKNQLVDFIEETQSSEDRLNTLFTGLQGAFREMGEAVESEQDLNGAAMKAMARYQEYRDAKRRSLENRDAMKRHEQELQELTPRLENAKKEEIELALLVREFLRSNGYAEEQNFESALEALRNYQIRSAQSRTHLDKVNEIQGQLKELNEKYESEKTALDELDQQLNRFLHDAGAVNVEEYHEKADGARMYHEFWKEREGLEEQLRALLNGQTLDELRNQAGQSRVVGSKKTTTELREAAESVDNELESKRKREHALHIMLTQRSAGFRSMNEVEEEREAVQNRLDKLEMELDAAQYAAEVLETVTKERHSRIAPQLAHLASGYLNTITGGAYEELLISRDMDLSVRIPQTRALHSEPEQMLSTGTVDQIYLALRLAMVSNLSEGSESIPLVLDDPFANYDDERLMNALKLLKEVSKTNQITLFTCREDVLKAAKEVGSPVFNLA